MTVAGALLHIGLIASNGVFVAWGAQMVRSSSMANQTPMARVVQLIQELAAKVEGDGKAEQQSYDQYACWCEDTLARKASDISNAKESIAQLSTSIEKLKGEIGTHASEIADLNKAVAANIAAQKEASEVRASGNQEYVAEKTESEQCIGALEAAIKVLNGAGAKRGFLETMQTAQLLSVVAGVRTVLRRTSAHNKVSDDDLRIVQRFVEHPQDFVGKDAATSAVQIAQNPFGDYAPQSTQIQGILKGMYDAFTGELEKANVEESEERKAFEALMATKKAELATLQATLERHSLDKAQKTKQEAEAQQTRDDTQAQLAADETFFEETKAGCKSKANDWNERSRLRTEELSGMHKAVEILSSPASQAIFVNATTTFLQADAIIKVVDIKPKAWQHLTVLAQRFKSANLAKIAAQLRSNGHFDAVITAIDKMMALLREEEQADIAHRDRCEGNQNKNTIDMEDLEHSIAMTNQSLDRMATEEGELKTKVSLLEVDINGTKEDMAELQQLRIKESTVFLQALQDDMDAAALLDKAIVALSDFYKRNNMPIPALVETKQPDYTADVDKAPDTIWDGANYGGRSSESGGIIAILHMLREDMEMDISIARKEDVAAQKEYTEQRNAMQNSLVAQVTTKSATEMELAELQTKIQDAKEFRERENKDLSAQVEQQSALYTDCSWVDTHFESRRDKRKVEMQGLADAKAYLAGVEAGDEV